LLKDIEATTMWLSDLTTYHSAYKNRHETDDRADWHRSFVIALAFKFTSSSEEADAAANEIFADIQHYARRNEITGSPEDRVASMMARRRLMKYLQTH
jgi:hypothetical protein